ncbi:acetaldehyde dehydrogenase [Salinisphaera sp. PC39]|uniref:acetaldehyde dehydrogenase (acetylating) n=1 Tax=Salinisphaera sp. PC39 TaxID=1304156 RepID=UPI00333F3BBC
MTMKAAVIGSGNIGTDLMIKIMRNARHLEMAVMVGIDPESDGLARAKRLGVATCAEGVDGLIAMSEFADIDVVFDATSAKAHLHNDRRLREVKPAIQVIDLTPAATGPYCIPVVNLDQILVAEGVNNVNMVTCGGQATVPMVAAVASVAEVRYAEIVASISSRSAGPGTRANIDEFTETTAMALERVGGAKRGKAIIILNPAEPPLLMRDTVYTLSPLDADEARIESAVNAMVERVANYVPGYRLKQQLQFERFDDTRPLNVPGIGKVAGLKTTIFLEVEGAAHYLPAYAGNLDIMTSAALATAERFAERVSETAGATA